MATTLDVVGLTTAAAQLNLLPYGYERFGQRISVVATALGKWNIAVAAAAVGGYALNRAIRKAAEDPTYKGFETLNRTLGNSALSVSSLEKRFDGLITTMSKGVKVANDFVAIPLAEALVGATGSGSGPDATADQKRFRGSMRTAREGMAADDAAAERRSRMADLGRAGGSRELALARDRSSHTGGTAERDKVDAAAFKEWERERGEIDKEIVAQVDARKKLTDAGADPEKDPEVQALNRQIALLREKRSAIRDAEDERRKTRRSEDEARYARYLEQSARIGRELVEVEKQRKGTNWDAQRIITLKEINAAIDAEIAAINRLTDTSEASEREREERMQRIHQLQGRRVEELEREKQIRLQLADIAARSVDAGDDITLDQVKADFSARQQARDMDRQRIEMQREAGIISTEQADKAKMELAANRDGLELLKETQRIEREQLEREAKRTAELRKQAKTAKEAAEAEQRAMNLAAQSAETASRHARERAAAERDVADSMRQQEMAQQQAREQQQIENMRPALDARRNAMTGEGGVLSRMQGRISPQAKMLDEWQKRSAEAIVKRQQEEGRKLNERERNQIIEQQRRDLVRQGRGPSDRDQARELARQRQEEREWLQQQRAAIRKLPPGMRRAAMQNLGEQVQQREADRQSSLRDGSLAGGMNADFKDDMAGAQERLTNKAIETMQRNGQITEAMAESMKNAANVMANMERELAGLQQSVAIIDAQIQTVGQSNQRRAAQRQGGGRP
jgi:hypothetical protein